MIPSFHRSLALILIVLGLASATHAADTFEGRLILTLTDALDYVGANATARTPSPRPINVYLTCQNGQWVRAWGYARTYNANVHEGRVIASTSTPDAMKLTLEMTIESDNWIKGGTGTWTLDLKRSGQTITGTVSGKYIGLDGGIHEPLNKPVTGLVLPPNVPGPDFKPVANDEHPRLLFRKADLPRIKERLTTPLGQAVLARIKDSNDPIALGMMFQITGDRGYAERSFVEAAKVMADRNQGAFALGRAWGYKTRIVGLAYDLCFDAWNEEQREQTENYLDEILDLCLNRKHRVGTVNWSPGSNYTVVIHAGNGMAAMAMMGRKTHPPAPIPALRTEPPRFTAPADLKPGKGVPVVALPIDQTPTQWLVAGPIFLHFQSPLDPLDALGGVAGARPQADEPLAFRSQKSSFRPISRETHPQYFMDGGNGDPKVFGVPKGKTAILTPAIAGREQTRLFFYNIVQVQQAGWYRYKANFWNGQCYLNGQRLGDGEIAYLNPGRYPLMVPVVLGSPTGTAYPIFIPSTEEEATRYYADPARQQSHQAALASWQRTMDAWKTNGGVNQAWLKYVRQLESWNILNLELGMMEGGFQGEGEGYTLECHDVIHDYALAFRNVFGRDISGRNDLPYFTPRYIATTVLWSDGKQVRTANQTFGRGEGSIGLHYLTRSIALSPRPWQPAVLWFWLERLGLRHEDLTTPAGVQTLLTAVQSDGPLPAIQMLLHLPLDLKPQNPGQVMPRAWESSGRGLYAFRNQWSGKDDIVAQIYGRTGKPCGWNQPESGSFQIWALGREMAMKVNDAAGKTGSRWFDNVVMLPEDPINASTQSITTYTKLDPATGSGVVTFDMSPLYMGIEQYKNDKGADAKRPIDLGIRGLRSFAADYSGKSTAPGLFAVVDKITGGKSKQWVFQLPEALRDGPKYDLAIDPRGFTITWNDASLRATVISPANPKIARSSGILKAHPLSGVADVAPNALLITSPDQQSGEFFVILTVQKNNAPPVTVTGQGLAATATIADQVIRFDGNNLVIGK